jgi:acyl-CoA synthetase (AMP-forming)/AMP-acid ligase II
MLPLTPIELLRSALAMGGRREAVVDGELRYSYENLAAAVMATADLLAEMNVRRGDRVAHLGRTSAAHVVLLFATAKLGAMYVPLDPWARPAALTRLLRFAAPRLTLLGHTLRGRRLALDLAESTWTFPEGIETVDATAGVPPTDWLNDAQLPHVVLFTSGTTGEPRGVVYTQAGFASQAFVINLGLAMTPHDRFLNVYAASHFGSVMPAMETVACGGCVVQLPIPDPQLVLSTLESERISVLVAVPGIWRSLLSHAAASRTDFRALRLANVASDSIPPALIERVMDVTGAISMQGYGLTEAGLVTLLPQNEARTRLGSAGLVLPFAAIKVVRGDGEPAGPGEEGEILVRTSYGMTGLWNGERVVPVDHDADGFSATGDLGWVDADGYLTVTGRLDDYLRVSGFRLSIAAIEDALRAHPACADAAVVALPAGEGRHVPAALVVPKPHVTLHASDLRGWVVAALQPQSAPGWIGVAEVIPRTEGTGKVRRKEIVQKFQRGEYVLVTG